MVLSGYRDWKDQADFFLKELNCKAVVITLGKEGVVGKTEKGYFQYFPKRETVAESVIGAGDCFVAFLAMAVAKMPIADAVMVAWEAGAVYVQRKHNRPVSAHDLLKHIDPIVSKYTTPEWLADRDFEIVLLSGTFDMLHAGHMEALKFCQMTGKKVVVAVNSDESLKGSPPLIPLGERMEMLAQLQYVDHILSFDEPTPLELIETIVPEVIVKGGNMKPEEVVGFGITEEVKVCPLLKGVSTKEIVEKIKEQK
jgi:D-beta-D-heptose 7-phosphate kinase/D-beta-D-heptose 1-phosphate adenosyltransferase